MNYQYFVNVQMTQLPILDSPNLSKTSSQSSIRVQFNLIKRELCGYPGDNQRHRVTFIFIIANIYQFTFSFFCCDHKINVINHYINNNNNITGNNNKKINLKKIKLVIAIENISYNTK